MKIQNITELMPEDKGFELDGKTYILPGSVPLRKMLKLMKYSQLLEEDATNVDAFEGAINAVGDIIAIKNPDVDIEKFLDEMNVVAYQNIVETLYTQDKPEGETKN